jgi:hypothetical protein
MFQKLGWLMRRRARRPHGQPEIEDPEKLSMRLVAGEKRPGRPGQLVLVHCTELSKLAARSSRQIGHFISIANGPAKPFCALFESRKGWRKIC